MKHRACLASLYIGITLHRLVILETHCSFVVSFLAHDNLNRSSLVDFKKKALVITKLLSNFKLAKINRRANVVAYQIAKSSFDNRSIQERRRRNSGVLANSEDTVCMLMDRFAPA